MSNKETNTVNAEVVVDQTEGRSSSVVQTIMHNLGLNPLGIVLILVMFVLPFIPPFNQEHLLRWLVGAALIAASAVAFDFTTGYINVVNFGFAALMGVGAYTSALLAVELGIPPFVGMLGGALVSAALGFVVGILTLRLRGIFAALMSWFVGLALMGLARNLVDLTRGPAGLSCPTFLETASNRPYFYIILVMMLITYFVLRYITRSKAGLAFRAIGQNIDAARASGVNPTFYRVLNFTLQCAFAGWLGGFYAHYYGILTPQIMHTSKTVEVLAIAYIGGRGSLWGGMVIAFPFIFLMEWLRSSLADLPGLHLVIYGALLILVMIFYPGGVAQVYYSISAWIKKRRTNAVNSESDGN
jgi:branched-chain amino acid transport system permease protein